VHIDSTDDLLRRLLDEVEEFFANYTRQRGKMFKPLGRTGPNEARKIVENGAAAFHKKCVAQKRSA
jgi:inorganic pyrophosphatase